MSQENNLIMRLKTLLVLIVLILFSLNVQADSDNMETRKKQHVIFLIHGIAGNKTHFGYMSEALPLLLNQKDSSTNYIAQSIEYDTGNNEKTPYEFAMDVSLVIEEVIAPLNFQKEDRLSLIMHSQGGLIGSIWMFQSLMSTPDFSSPETIEHLDSFITLGSLFWGAKTAQWGSEIKNLTDMLGVEVPLPFGKKELEQMSFGSDMIFDFRMALLDTQYKKNIEYLKSRVRFLNVVGVADLLNPLGIFVSGIGGKYEDDGAVPLASARFNFLYNQAIDGEYKNEDRVRLDNVKEIDMAPYVIVNAMHRSPLPELDNFAGIAQIPKACINNEDCKHPTLPYLLKHLLGEKVEQIDKDLVGFRTFLLDINVRVASDRQYACKDLKVDFSKLDGSSLKKSNIEISKFYEFYSQGQYHSEKYPNHCRFYCTGSIKESLPEGQNETVLIKVSGEKLRTRYVEMYLKESYSSFVDIQLTQ